MVRSKFGYINGRHVIDFAWNPMHSSYLTFGIVNSSHFHWIFDEGDFLTDTTFSFGISSAEESEVTLKAGNSFIAGLPSVSGNQIRMIFDMSHRTIL
jgi:hypothetical protein